MMPYPKRFMINQLRLAAAVQPKITPYTVHGARWGQLRLGLV